jgi:hypothetical protein
MAGDTTAVLATRDMIVYYAPYDGSNAFPDDDDIDFGEAWGAPWVDAGYTDGGMEINISVDRAEITVDQLMEPVLRPITGRDITFSTDLAQMTVENLQLAGGLGEVATVAPGAGTKGHDTLALDASVPTDSYNSWGFEALQQNGEPFRAVIWNGLAIGSPTPSFGQADTKAMVALEIAAVPDSSTSPERLAEFRNVLPAA